MRYKYSLPTRIRNAVEWHVESYPENRRELERSRQDEIPSPTPAYSLSGGGGTDGRKTEEVAVRIMSAPYLRRLEQSCRAVEVALRKGDSLDRKLLELVYWRREYTVTGAAMKLHISNSGAYKRLNRIFVAVAVEMGYVTE